MTKVVGLLVLGAALACLGLELLFRVLPVSTSTSMDYYTDPSILSYPPHHRFVASSGWDLENAERVHTNNAGFVASQDFVANPLAIALIGDSFVEASMLDAADRLAARIEQLAGRPVYAFGGPGSSLLDYAERVRFAATKYAIDDFVIVIEEGDVLQAICGSGQVHGRCLDESSGTITAFRQPSAGTLKRILRHSALAQFLTSQLKIDVGALLANLRPAPTPSAPVEAKEADKSRELTQIVQAFFARVAQQRPERLILVLEDRTVSGMQRSEAQRLGREILLREAAAAGALVVDTGAPFRDFTRTTGLSVAVSPRDHHWNGAATSLVAREVAAGLRP
jgi:hypothetical protein